MNTELYRRFFPERVPTGNLSTLWTESQLFLGGRTNPAKEWTITAKSYGAEWARLHFQRLFFDDLVGEQTCSPPYLLAVKRFLAGVRGLCNPVGDISRHHIGTIYDEDDDNKFLLSIERCLSILVPIETYDHAVENVEIRGTPTNPEWHSTERIVEIQQDVCGDPEQGPLSYKRNFWLNPYAGGGRMFSASAVDNANWRATRVNKVLRLLLKVRAADGSFAQTTNGEIKTRAVDADALFRVLGVDPAFSVTGDDWAITCAGMDELEHAIQLETVAGKGFDELKRNLLLMIRKWNPKKVGIEKAAAQEQTFKTLLEENRDFRRVAHLFQAVSHDGKSKEWRIANAVAEPITMGKLHLNPDDVALKQEMKVYVPGRKAIDNRLDSLAIAYTLLRKARSGNSGNWKETLERRRRRLEARKPEHRRMAA
jgi:hypothetical protein